MPDTWAIAQTIDGWLWFGGPNGLTRLDGLSFEKVELISPDSRLSNGVRALYATPDGVLLIGHQSGGVSILKDGRFLHFDTEQTRRAQGVIAFAEGVDGVIWATAMDGLMRFDGKLWQIFGSEWNFPGGRSGAALVYAPGTLSAATENEVLRLPPGGTRFERVGQYAVLDQTPNAVIVDAEFGCGLRHGQPLPILVR